LQAESDAELAQRLAEALRARDGGGEHSFDEEDFVDTAGARGDRREAATTSVSNLSGELARLLQPSTGTAGMRRAVAPATTSAEEEDAAASRLRQWRPGGYVNVQPRTPLLTPVQQRGRPRSRDDQPSGPETLGREPSPSGSLLDQWITQRSRSRDSSLALSESTAAPTGPSTPAHRADIHRSSPTGASANRGRRSPSSGPGPGRSRGTAGLGRGGGGRGGGGGSRVAATYGPRPGRGGGGGGATAGDRGSGVERQTMVAPFRAPPPGADCDSALLECAICMESFEEGVAVRTLPCMHRYHVPCADRWLARNPECPICKHRLDG